jgi:hypothetical protein
VSPAPVSAARRHARARRRRRRRCDERAEGIGIDTDPLRCPTIIEEFCCLQRVPACAYSAHEGGTNAKDHDEPAPYRTTRKALPEGTAGQRRAVYDAINNGAATAAAIREAVRGANAFKGAKPETLAANAAWHFSRLKRDGFVKGGR